MAATRLIALHVNKGKTVAQCLADRTDYSQNAAKTNDGEFISSYECDPKTADEEFLLSKRQYQHITGRQQKNNIIAYQIRQSFKPGEITPEEANQVGYETAMRWTKGKHAFIVATHIDKSHIHNHIIYNSTSLDATRKFKNFFLSGLAVQRLSDMVCLEHGLSIITPKPYRERQKRTVYPIQNYNLVPILNVYENIVLPVELDGDTVDQKFLDEIVHLLGLEDKLKNMPNNLSGGQQQRVAIARALITKPAIVLADEPTGNLDSKTSAEVLGLIKRTSAEFRQTVVMITHNDDIARLADRIVRIEDGKIVE